MTLLSSEAGATGIVLLIGAVLLSPGLGRAPFDDPGEGMHAEIAREILLSGDPVTLHLNGIRYFDKPPLLYWLTASSLLVFGPTEWAARLWPVAGALAAVGGTALLGTWLLGPRAGVVSGLALLTSPGFFAYSCYLRPETLFVAAIQWGFALLVIAPLRSPRLAVLGLAVLGTAALAKDPLGALAPIAAVAAARAAAGQLRPLSAWLPWRGVALLLLLGGTWYLLVEFRNPGFLWYTVVDNHLLNVIRARHFPDEDIPLSSFEFVTVATLGAFPWVIAAALTVGALLRRRSWREPRELPWLTLAIWAVGVYAFFALVPFKLPHYALPAHPAVALLAARWWEERRAARAVLALHLLAFAALALGFGWVYFGDGRAFTSAIFGTADVYTRKEAVIGQSAPIPPWQDLKGLVGGTALASGTGALGLLAAVARGSRTLGLSAVLLALLLWVPLVGRAGALVATSRSISQMAQEVSRRAGPGDLLVHEGPIENSGALEFYSGVRPAILDGRVSVLGYGATFPEAQDTFWGRAQLADAWRSPRRVFLVTTRSGTQSAVSDLPPSEVYVLAVGGGRWLYSNRP